MYEVAARIHDGEGVEGRRGCGVMLAEAASMKASTDFAYIFIQHQARTRKMASGLSYLCTRNLSLSLSTYIYQSVKRSFFLFT